MENATFFKISPTRLLVLFLFHIITTVITFIEIPNSDWSRTVIWSHWPVFHFSMNPVRIHEGGSTSIWQKKLWQRCLFFAFFLVLGLVYRSQMVNFKEKYHFSRFRRGVQIFPGGSNFFQGGGGGVRLLIPYRNPNNLWFSRGGSGPPAPLWIRTWLRSISFPSPQNDAIASCLALVLVFLQLRCMFTVEHCNKIVSWTYCMTVAWFIQHLLQFVFAFVQSFNKDSSISFCWGSFLFLSKPFWQMMLFVTNVNEWRHILWRNYRTHSNEHPC